MRVLMGVLLAGTALLLSACGGQGKPDKVLAVVNGQAITESALEEEAKTLPPYVRPILESPSGRAQFLESLITRDLLMQEALRRGLERRDDVRERLNMARRSILLDALLREVTENAPGLSDNVLRQFYDANTESFAVGERVRVSHILFKDRAKAEETAVTAKKGVPFEGLVKEAPSGGGTAADLGFIERGSFVKEFEEAAFSARPGTVVGPVKTPYGFHVIRVGEKKAAGTKSFEEVKGQIADDLREQAQREAFETLLAQLKKHARIRLTAAPEPEALPPAAGPPAVPGKKEAPAGVVVPSPGGGR